MAWLLTSAVVPPINSSRSQTKIELWDQIKSRLSIYDVGLDWKNLDATIAYCCSVDHRNISIFHHPLRRTPALTRTKFNGLACESFQSYLCLEIVKLHLKVCKFFCLPRPPSSGVILRNQIITLIAVVVLTC